MGQQTPPGPHRAALGGGPRSPALYVLRGGGALAACAITQTLRGAALRHAPLRIHKPPQRWSFRRARSAAGSARGSWGLGQARSGPLPGLSGMGGWGWPVGTSEAPCFSPFQATSKRSADASVPIWNQGHRSPPYAPKHKTRRGGVTLRLWVETRRYQSR